MPTVSKTVYVGYVKQSVGKTEYDFVDVLDLTPSDGTSLPLSLPLPLPEVPGCTFSWNGYKLQIKGTPSQSVDGVISKFNIEATDQVGANITTSYELKCRCGYPLSEALPSSVPDTVLGYANNRLPTQGRTVYTFPKADLLYEYIDVKAEHGPSGVLLSGTKAGNVIATGNCGESNGNGIVSWAEYKVGVIGELGLNGNIIDLRNGPDRNKKNDKERENLRVYFKLRIARDTNDNQTDDLQHDWTEFTHVRIRTAGATAAIDQQLQMFGIAGSLRFNGITNTGVLTGLNVAASGVGVNVSATSTLANFSVDAKPLADVRFSYGGMLEVVSQDYKSLLPSRSYVGKRIAKTNQAALQFQFTQSHFQKEKEPPPPPAPGADTLTNLAATPSPAPDAPTKPDQGAASGSKWYAPEEKDYIDQVKAYGSEDTAYGAPVSILKQMKEHMKIFTDVKWVTVEGDGTSGAGDFIVAMGDAMNAREMAEIGGTNTFIFSAGYNCTFQFRSLKGRTFTFGGGHTHHFSPIRDLYHDKHSVVAERDYLVVEASASYHYKCKNNYAGDIVDKSNPLAATFKKRGDEKSEVQYRYEGPMWMRVAKKGTEAKPADFKKPLSEFSMDEEGHLSLSGFQLTIQARDKNGEVKPDQFCLKMSDQAIAIQHEKKLTFKTEEVEFKTKKMLLKVDESVKINAKEFRVEVDKYDLNISKISIQ